MSPGWPLVPRNVPFLQDLVPRGWGLLSPGDAPKDVSGPWGVPCPLGCPMSPGRWFLLAGVFCPFVPKGVPCPFPWVLTAPGVPCPLNPQWSLTGGCPSSPVPKEHPCGVPCPQQHPPSPVPWDVPRRMSLVPRPRGMPWGGGGGCPLGRCPLFPGGCPGGRRPLSLGMSPGEGCPLSLQEKGGVPARQGIFSRATPATLGAGDTVTVTAAGSRGRGDGDGDGDVAGPLLTQPQG